ncbi:hypothetical protein ACHQM5_008877 [Ranunculus cassubicifolius]
MDIGVLTILISSIAFLYFLLDLLKFFYRVWWYPIHIQKLFESQGIKGPSYKFLHGSTKAVLNMTRNATKSPMELTNDILPRVQPHVHLWVKLYGRNFLHWQGCKPQLFVTEPNLIREILNNKSGVYIKSKPDEYMKKLLGDGLVIAEGEKWSRQRKLANRAFHKENLKGMFPTMITCVNKMLERWRYHEGKEIEVHEEFRVLTSDVISRTAFGSNYVEGQQIFCMLTKMASIVAGNASKIKLPIVGKFINFSEDSEAKKMENGMRKSFLEIVEKRKEKVHSGELDGYGTDYLGLLINANKNNNVDERISVDDMIDECKTFYFAGHETTMSLLTWTVFLLAVNADWQEKARKEVFDLFGKEHPNTEDGGIAKMKTITMVINETLRLYPPAVVLRRTNSCQVKLGDILLPPNTYIIIPPLVRHHDPEIWGDDVHIFKPDRFAERVTNAAKDTNVYVPFGIGPRICVGSNFAIMEVKIALSMILQRYAFALSPTYMHSPVQYITIRPQHGVQIILHPL